MARSPSAWPRPGRFDVLGLILVLALGAWVAFAAGDGAGRPGPLLWLLTGLVLAFAIGRALAPRGFLDGVVAVGVAGAVLLTWPGLLQSGGGPTGYANANATLVSLATVAALGAARVSTDDTERRVWSSVAGAFAVATLLTGSIAGSASLVTALAIASLGHLLRRPGIVIVGGIAVVAATLAVTTAIALGADPGGLGERAGLRGELWAVAADLIEETPVRGVGPGEFAARNPVSVDDDLRLAHHGYLQVGAELGVVGLTFVLALGGWLWVSLWRARHNRSAVELGGAALMIVALHGTVDWVWHVPGVLVVLAAMLGAAAAVSRATLGSPHTGATSAALHGRGRSGTP